MPSATILSPKTGDTVNATNVPISVAYANFTAATDLKCKIHTANDTPENVNGAGLHGGTATTTASPPQQSVVVFTDADGELARQDGVKVTSGDTPAPIDPPVIEEAVVKGPKKIKKVKGSVPAASTAAYVVCQVIEVNAQAGTYTVVAAGAGTVDARKKWDIAFDVTVDVLPHIQYAARAFAYKSDLALLGSETIPIKKPNAKP